ncbi:DUF1775 domain-containing protein [Colwellia sp. D2M02]|uniref:DUF1775 domain-containing protein n=1 Tax=Colwellia sp. D2M02 TaxID=2841562 RepID=UPI001C09D981|nr:DUF1775 domain-containing protein [Colwellia sp. D2M02]MBU2894214.1 DUF1775 domain-containing protein [Colwellia sp. D2M02]
MKKVLKTSLLASSCIFTVAVQAHVGVASGPHFANKTSIIELSIPHGCTDEVSGSEDTVRIVAKVPSSITSVHAIDAVFGQATAVFVDGEHSYNEITWVKTPGTERDSDTQYYKVAFRGKLPDATFSTVFIPTTQYCINDIEQEISVSWDVESSGHDHHGGGEGNPAPSLMVMPARTPGWNQYTTGADQHLHDMSIFNDAEIVWWDDAAFSSNVVTQELIEAEGKAALSEIHDNASFWVKY